VVEQWDAAPRTTLLNPWVEQVEQNRLGHSNEVLWSAVFVLRLVLPEFAALDSSFLHLGDAMLLGLYRRVNPKDFADDIGPPNPQPAGLSGVVRDTGRS
jgi:hypothetical protein